MREHVILQTLKQRIIAIVRGVSPDSIAPLMRALLDGGIGMAEVTFNLSKPESFGETAKAISIMREIDGLIPGAGTVVTPELVEIAANAGARFIVSPNVDAAVIAKTRELGLVSMPGAATPSEAVAAHNAGADFIKLFPAGNLGPGYLEALCAPLSHLRFLAVGGVDENNAAEFMRAGAVGLGLAGELVNRDWIATGQFDKITRLADEICRAARAV